MVSGTQWEMQCFWKAANSFSSVAASSACGRVNAQNCAGADSRWERFAGSLASDYAHCARLHLTLKLWSCVDNGRKHAMVCCDMSVTD